VTSEVPATLELRRIAFAIAYRMLGDPPDAEDLAQETLVRWMQVDQSKVLRPDAYVASMSARLALNLLRNRSGRRRLLDRYGLPVPLIVDAIGAADSRLDVSYGLLVLTRSLTPLARAVFILRSAFELSFEEIGVALERTPEACRQINSRAQRALERSPLPGGRNVDLESVSRLVDRIAAADIQGVLQLLADEVVVTTDGGGTGPDLGRPIGGRERIARLLVMSPALLGQELLPRVVETEGGRVVLIESANRLVMSVIVEGDGALITALYVLSDLAKLGRMAVTRLGE
jgi:DNA-directed RNA polymerase specialized sigma24 family protein/ketosteroid isomerase-like protein